ncbi:hypothetical protein HW130_13660 [Streptomyces sp. PKU-EA00015]|uniref:hypothetical protein n=1 Tax=Streptomyces sp. PKU-EA00015 TaxID=2748326 RepID=UPI00159FC8A6|nr:hypothetical protein [Streptomyces sp. PKU-EA00015]NWF27307.1 hypothetical protein [Streptomyces sp. PKU-EA00015]
MTTSQIPPLEHRAFREMVENDYRHYAQVFLDDDQRNTAVSNTFDLLWLRWNEPLAGPDIRRFAWDTLRTTVMTRTPHIDGRPEFGAAAFDTVALRHLTTDTKRLQVRDRTVPQDIVPPSYTASPDPMATSDTSAKSSTSTAAAEDLRALCETLVTHTPADDVADFVTEQPPRTPQRRHDPRLRPAAHRHRRRRPLLVAVRRRRLPGRRRKSP